MATSKRQAKEELIAHDMKRLHGLGYAQELFRAMGGFSNFAISFTIISILSGCVTLFYLTTLDGGYSAASIGWPLITVFVVIVALGMAELASAFPTAGGLYYWASKLGFRGRGGPAWGWFTGWFNLIGQIGITAGIAYGAAITLDTLLHAWFPGVPATVYSISSAGAFYDPATQQVTLLIYAIILAAVAMLNIFGVRIVAFLNDVSVWWHIVGVLLIVVGVVGATLLSYQFNPGASGVSPATQVTGAAVHGFNSVSTVFTPNNNFNSTGYPLWYAFLLGLLLAQYTYTGYDASAHMTEETIGAETRAPWGVVMSVVVSAFAGYALLMGLVAASPNLLAAGGFVNPVLYILQSRLSYVLGTLLFAVIFVAQFFCSMSSVTSNSRMIYAFSRDGAVPGHNLWHRLNRGRTPRNAILLAVVCSFILAIPSLGSVTAYVAVTSIATIGLYIAYAIPIFLRQFSTDFERGPWHLGAWSRPIGWIAVIWVVFISVLFMLPTFNPASLAKGVSPFATFNYAPVAVLGVLVIVTIWWLVSARKWFKGPIIQGSETELEAIERSVGETVHVEGSAGGGE
ncbi:MAG TPA: amino acid permease [Ktedonobacteraceae bacterium]|nr:amino acid permease [Ktedonobacteraceae bacterium]